MLRPDFEAAIERLARWRVELPGCAGSPELEKFYAMAVIEAGRLVGEHSTGMPLSMRRYPEYQPALYAIVYALAEALERKTPNEREVCMGGGFASRRKVKELSPGQRKLLGEVRKRCVKERRAAIADISEGDWCPTGRA